MRAPGEAAPRHAIILAAGLGTRLRPLVDGMPKGLVEIGGETLVGRSIRVLREAGIEAVTIVAGYGEAHYRRLVAGRPDVRVLSNSNFATSGSMASLAIGLASISEDVLVLESDILYEPRALAALLQGPADATLVSGPTGAGDEVWVYAPQGRLRSMSKNRAALAGATGEFVGITRLSRAAGAAMLAAFQDFIAVHHHARMDYEADGLVGISQRFPIAAVLVADLCWGEIDDERHFNRIVQEVWPRLAAHPRTPPASGHETGSGRQ